MVACVKRASAPPHLYLVQSPDVAWVDFVALGRRRYLLFLFLEASGLHVTGRGEVPDRSDEVNEGAYGAWQLKRFLQRLISISGKVRNLVLDRVGNGDLLIGSNCVPCSRGDEWWSSPRWST